MDSDGSGIVTNEEFKRFVTRTLGLTAENADDVLASLCQARDGRDGGRGGEGGDALTGGKLD